VKYSLDKKTWSEELPVATAAGTYGVWYSAFDEDGNQLLAPRKVSVTIEPAKAIESFDVTIDETYFDYDGTAKQPAVSVTGRMGEIAEGTDYAIAYVDNINAGIAKAVVTGMGNYGGTKSVEFHIAPKPLTSMELETVELVYNGEEQTVQAINVMADEMEVPASAYTLDGNVQTEAGTYTVTLISNPDANFTGTLMAEFTITPLDIKACTMTVSPDRYVYNAKEHKPAVTVMHGETTLAEGKDYTISYQNNVNAGKATVTVNGQGNLTASIAKQYTIVQGTGDIDVLKKELTVAYSATPLTVNPIVRLGDGVIRFSSSNTEVAEVLLYPGDIYMKNIGQTTITLTMAATPNATADTTSFVLNVVPGSAAEVKITTWQTNEGIPEFTVATFREKLVEGTDYTLSFKSLVGEPVSETQMVAAPGQYYVVATLKGKYEGTVEQMFTANAVTTGIDGVAADGTAAKRYDMNGRRVERPRRGLIIENGHKRYIKK